MHAERIGHGYRILADEKAYKRCRDENVHFEVCPTSSVLTGSVPIYQAATLHHPILRFARDGVNFSVNTDDPTVTGTTLDYEYRMLGDWGMTEGTLCGAVSRTDDAKP
jgi:adenosine deaminase